MVDTKQLSKEIRSLIKTASKADQDSVMEAIDESALSDSMKVKLHEELQVRLNESEQEGIDEAVAAGKKDEAQELIDRKHEEINSEKDMKALPTVSAEIPKHKEIEVKTEEDMKKVQSGWNGKLVGYDPVAKIAKILASVLILAVMLVPVSFADMTDKGSLGDGSFVVTSSGNLEPAADETYNIGSTSKKVASIYAGAVATTGITATNVIGSMVIATQYLRMQYVASASLRPASGAPAGSLISIGNGGTAQDCGATAEGTNYVVCTSNGTNWVVL